MYGSDLSYHSTGKFFVISWFKCHITTLSFTSKCMLTKVIYIYIFSSTAIDPNFANTQDNIKIVTCSFKIWLKGIGWKKKIMIAEPDASTVSLYFYLSVILMDQIHPIIAQVNYQL